MRIRYTATLKALNNVPTDLIIFCNQQFQTVGAWMDCDGQWLHRVGTTRNLFVGKRCISSVNWWQQLLPRVRCGNLLALQRRTCGGRTRVPAQSVSATFHLSTHPCHLVSTLLLEGAHILEAHMPGRTYRGRNAGAHMPGRSCRGAHAWGRTCRGRVRTQTTEVNTHATAVRHFVF
jgi:hypothetical protein